MTEARHSILQPLKQTDGYKIQVRVYATQYGEFLHTISTTSLIEVSQILCRNQCVHMKNLDRISIRSNRQRSCIHRLWYQRSHSKVMGVTPSHQISKSYGIVQNSTQCTHVSHHSCRIESPLKLTIIFSYDYYHHHLLLSLIKKASKIARLHGPRTSLGHFEFKLHMGFTYTNQVTIGGSADKNLPLLTMFPRKLLFLRMFPLIT